MAFGFSPNDLHQVTRVTILPQPNETFLDAPRRHEPVEDIDTSCLVIRSAPPTTSEGLLTYDGSRAFLVVIHVSGCIPKLVCGFHKHLPVRSEADKALSTPAEL